MKQKIILTIFLFICILCGLSAEDNGFKLLTTEEAQKQIRDQAAACNELEYLRSNSESLIEDTTEPLFILLPDEMIADIVSYEKNKFSIRMYNGNPVYALSDGIVSRVHFNSSDGNFTAIQTGNIVIKYVNLRKVATLSSKGTTIKVGDLIAFSGGTGAIFEPQLGIRIEAAEDSDRDYTIYLITSKSLK
ncbi:M23 family metallopeptidase [Brucepastera parasyntrophica]|uniref:M23 family metallopeptidase n=1 Tax=Brucepastera parasyntrophica TaxID=2880008 RepID=UPI00210CEB93|nr:M23 family metallopeptidase [Brucepastera parasyntrophica]ULQ60264.1 M23 family metallopeptidase [Brucepastera parasyntrophica]